MTDYIYDFEVLPNVWTCYVYNCRTGKYFKFEISPRRNDFKRFIKWTLLRQANGDRAVGFNNEFYDYPVWHAMMTEFRGATGAKSLTNAIYKRSKDIIKTGNLPGLGRFKYTVWPNDQIVKQIDLFKIYHFDNKAKRTSLKRLQFNMRLPSIVEFDVSFDEFLDVKEIPKLLTYNKYDVSSTHKFYELSLEQIKFREEMSEEIGKSLLSANDTKIGMDHITKSIKERIGSHVLFDEDGKKITTKHSEIPLDEVIFDFIQFDHPEFRKVLAFMKTLKIFIVKGKFHWNEKDDYREGLKLINEAKEAVKEMRRDGLRKGDPALDAAELGRNILVEKYDDYKITCEIDGFEFDFGKGGLHGARKGSVYRSNSTHVILDIDVTSFYPNIGIVKQLFPAHLTKAFCAIYAALPALRKQHKKGTWQNKLFKLIMNSFYGNTNSAHSHACDPKYTVDTTINGQLMLCMAWEKLREIPDIEIIQANTDGITFYINRKYVKQAGKICRDWQKTTGMQLEQAVYSQMFTRDVNNYVCEYKGGGIKAKGAYLFDSLYHTKGMKTDNIEWHKNHSMLVVQKAAQAAMLTGISVTKFIINHTDVYDFFLCTNVNRGSRLTLCRGDDEIQELQRNTRYLISNTDERLVKVMPPLAKAPNKWRKIGINTEYNVSIHNEVLSDDIDDFDINYQFYVDAALKLLKPFEGQL